MSKLNTLCDKAEDLDVHTSTLAGSIEFFRLAMCEGEMDIKLMGDTLYTLEREAKRIEAEAEEVYDISLEIMRSIEAVAT